MRRLYSRARSNTELRELGVDRYDDDVLLMLVGLQSGSFFSSQLLLLR